MIIGVDESGTGALAGPYVVAAVGLDVGASDRLRAAGVTDSKALSDTKRRALLEDIDLESSYLRVAVVDVPTISKHHGSKAAWTLAVNDVLSKATDYQSIIIDGNPVSGVRAPRGMPKFMVKADARVIAVGAASIVAKTIRNHIMEQLDVRFPEYGWAKNYGYGEHSIALAKKLGVVVHHRRTWAPLRDLPLRITKVANIHSREPYDVYIGRPGQGEEGFFGNPLRMGEQCLVCKDVHATAGQTLPCYRKWLRWKLRTDADYRGRFYALRGLTLGCFCAPAPCHGDVMVEFLDA
jgi:ribonuclease HII